jgi:hypothetical protein
MYTTSHVYNFVSVMSSMEDARRAELAEEEDEIELVGS